MTCWPPSTRRSRPGRRTPSGELTSDEHARCEHRRGLQLRPLHEYVRDGREAAEFGRFADGLHAGQPAPDFTVARLNDGTSNQIADLWRRKDLVMEFGSFT